MRVFSASLPARSGVPHLLARAVEELEGSIEVVECQSRFRRELFLEILRAGFLSPCNAYGPPLEAPPIAQISPTTRLTSTMKTESRWPASLRMTSPTRFVCLSEFGSLLTRADDAGLARHRSWDARRAVEMASTRSSASTSSGRITAIVREDVPRLRPLCSPRH